MSDFPRISYRCNDGLNTTCMYDKRRRDELKDAFYLPEEQINELPVILDEFGIDGYVDIVHSLDQSGNLIQCSMRVSKGPHLLFPRDGYEAKHKTRISNVEECPYSPCKTRSETPTRNLRNEAIEECFESLISDLQKEFTSLPYRPENHSVSFTLDGREVSYLTFIEKNEISDEQKQRLDSLVATAQSLGKNVELAFQLGRHSAIYTIQINIDGKERYKARKDCIPFLQSYASSEDKEECIDDILSELEGQLSEEANSSEEAEKQDRIVPLHKSLADLGLGLSVLGLVGLLGIAVKRSLFMSPILVPTELLESWGRPAGEDTA